MSLSIADAKAPANAVPMQLAFDAQDVAIAMRHLIDPELRGFGYIGFWLLSQY